MAATMQERTERARAALYRRRRRARAMALFHRDRIKRRLDTKGLDAGASGPLVEALRTDGYAVLDTHVEPERLAHVHRLLEDALALQEAGAFMVLMEMVPESLATRVTEALSVPTIGIGAGPGCSGQVLVIYDLLGLNDAFTPKFLKRYASLAEGVTEALTSYAQEVKERTFPGPAHTFGD